MSPEGLMPREQDVSYQTIDVKIQLVTVNNKGKENIVICISDNTHGGYSPINLDAKQIEEVWEFKASISCQIPKPGDLLVKLNAIEARLSLIEKQKLNSF